MHVISLLRSAVAGPRQRPVGALAILTVIVGVVTMHSMSGSPTSHAHAVPHEAAAVSTEQDATEPVAAEHVATAQVMAPSPTTEVLTASVVVMPVVQTPDGHPAGGQGADPCEGCCGDGLAAAMCLMILVAILALVVPARRLLWRAPLELAMSLTPALAVVRALAAPSLHELCISRT